MKKILLTSFSLFFFTINISAQIMELKHPSSSAGTLTSIKKDTEPIQGSVYLDDEFRLASVSGTNEQFMLRYNALTDIIEVQNEKKELFSLIKKEPFSTITFISSKTIIKLLNYKTKDGEVNGYLVELLNKNDVALYRRDKINLQKGKEATNSYSIATASRYIKANKEYYLRLKNETAIMIPKNKKELQDLFPNKKDEISTYLKKNNYSLNDEKSILEMAKFIANL